MRNEEAWNFLQGTLFATQNRDRGRHEHTGYDIETRQRHWEHGGLIKGRKRGSKQDNY